MKMKLTLKRILTSVLAGVMLLFSCAFVGCGEKQLTDGEISFSLVEDSIDLLESGQTEMKKIIHSYEELKALNNASLKQKYSFFYFFNKALIVYAFIAPNGGGEIEELTLIRKNGEICLNIDCSMDITTIVAEIDIFLEVKKAEVASTTDFQASVNFQYGGK